MGYLKGKPAFLSAHVSTGNKPRPEPPFHDVTLQNQEIFNTYIFLVENLLKIAYTTKRVQKEKGKLF